jgi:putative DNA methylase
MAKYIENTFPIGQLSLLAERESWRKEVYRPVYYIHKWWARRLGTVFRGIVLGACLDDNEELFSAFYSKNNFHEITILDPFMGSGVTIGEAIKLGCKAIGRDINPVAATITKASLSEYSIADVHKAYKAIERKVKPEIQKYYQTEFSDGELAEVLYYFHVKYLSCPHCNNEIELFKNRIFSKNAVPKKDPSARAFCPYCRAINHIRYDAISVSCDVCSKTYNPQQGNVRGANIECPHCEEGYDRNNRTELACSVRRRSR